jgi:hypothetical protein
LDASGNWQTFDPKAKLTHPIENALKTQIRPDLHTIFIADCDMVRFKAMWLINMAEILSKNEVEVDFAITGHTKSTKDEKPYWHSAG